MEGQGVEIENDDGMERQLCALRGRHRRQTVRCDTEAKVISGVRASLTNCFHNDCAIIACSHAVDRQKRPFPCLQQNYSTAAPNSTPSDSAQSPSWNDWLTCASCQETSPPRMSKGGCSRDSTRSSTMRGVCGFWSGMGDCRRVWRRDLGTSNQGLRPRWPKSLLVSPRSAVSGWNPGESEVVRNGIQTDEARWFRRRIRDQRKRPAAA